MFSIKMKRLIALFFSRSTLPVSEIVAVGQGKMVFFPLANSLRLLRR